MRPYYIDKKTGAQKALPGYSKINALDVLLTGNAEQYPSTETKTIPIYDFDKGEDVLTPSEVVTGWIGKPITGLVRAIRKFKKAKNNSGQWVATAETKDIVEVLHFVDAVTGQTRSEKLAGKEASIKPEFETKFNSSFVIDKTKGAKSSGSASTAPAAPEDTPFGKK